MLPASVASPSLSAPVALPSPAPAVPPRPGRLALEDTAGLQGRLWRGNSLGRTAEPVLASGFEALDAELPGGGWPLGQLSEVLQAQSGLH